MAVNSFLAQFGFESDPFESTNAETEPLLADYFVPPPYYTTVLGDPQVPSSHVVLAPRGSGKTAQRRMIEIRSTSDLFLCITYDHFDQPPGFELREADLAYHLNQVCRLILLGVLLRLEEHPDLADRLSSHQKSLIKLQVRRFLGDLSTHQYEIAVKSVKSLGDRAGDVWRKYGGPMAAGVQILLTKAGLDGVDVPSDLVSESRQDESLPYHLRNIIDVALALEFRSVYVLVDKVDETPLTSADANATYAMIRSLITDLPTLEMPGVCFKFFLWDVIAAEYRQTGGRPDRVPIHELRWSHAELADMLRNRLLAHSGQRVESLNQLSDPLLELDLDRLLTHFSQGSPRNLIRVAKAVVDEHTRIEASTDPIAESALWAGIRSYCDELALEICPTYLADLRKVGVPTFTTNMVANDVFRVTTQSARSKIQKWVATGAVTQVGERPNPGNRPLHLYGITDIRVAIAALTSLELPLILGNFALLCPGCDTLALSSDERIDCQSCGREFMLEDAQSLLSSCQL